MMNYRRRLCALLCAAAMVLGLAGCTETVSVQTRADEPVQLTVWNYYNGDQLECFNDLVETFNETVGAEQGIHVVAYSQGSVNDLEANILDAAEGKVGAPELPNIFSAYADTSYRVDQMGLLADIAPYFTAEEREQYLEGYLAEGDFDQSGSMKLFPIAKSTELLFLNDTDWQVFAQATGADYSDLSTMEGLVETAAKYYEWTDAQTDTPDDGKALFGRDAMANYLLIGARELGGEVMSVDNGRMTVRLTVDVARKLWDCYYVPMVKGYYEATGRFRSDDIKTGNILAYVGSSSSATFFPEHVMTSDTEEHEIVLRVLPAPSFADGNAAAVQQGANMAVTNSSEAEVAASVVFLKWFTQPENNIRFAAGSGYLPVTHEASSIEAIEADGVELTERMHDILSCALDVVTTQPLYTSAAFANGADARKVLEYNLSDMAKADRATVEQRIAKGWSAAEAEAPFLTDEYFEEWYMDICSKLRAYQKN